ncbi:hypothetical protein LJC27_07285 [Christensenellaceae bacterium OttesenSCG-928-M15]|nr:hypothetical protein [Christensenellaceae bacterium OttesenSCG-928-M15]
MKKSAIVVALLLTVLVVLSACGGESANKPGGGSLPELPQPRSTEGDYSLDASGITSANLLDYLNRSDTVYIDLRNYEDYALKHFKNFEVIPYFALVFDEAAGTPDKPQLFGGSLDAPVATYTSSQSILESMFPKDKTIMLMCQSGGRVEKMMKLLESLGYDMSKVYNVGGVAQYTGSEYQSYITDTEEVLINVEYSVNATPAA